MLKDYRGGVCRDLAVKGNFLAVYKYSILTELNNCRRYGFLAKSDIFI